ncbi:MAG: hypothetical protein JW862_00320, partial [Anaerolineales bacterium]|nr:hypothetical protein [Anaerolineales bacterium]
AYKLVEQLYAQVGRPQDCERFLDLVALGIVADVATQRKDTRYLLQRGLQVLRQAHRPALQAMLELAELPPAQLNEEQIAFLLAPRLNALGRLGDANPVVDFLTTTELGKARLFARQLESYNERRKLLTDQITQAAEAQLEREPGLLNTPALVLAGEGWHTGVVGIVASRLVERYAKPAILLSLEQDGLAKGSARSVPGVQITAAIASQAGLLTGYGGHAAAAGLALPSDRIPDFRRGLAQAILQQLEGQTLPGPQLQIDAYLPLAELSLELVGELERLAPFGAGNPALNLASRDLQLVSQRAIGKTGEHLRLVVADADGNQQNVLYWRGAGEALPDPETRFDLAYVVRANIFRAERQLQVEWLDFRVSSSAAPTVIEQPTIQVIDHRQANHPGAILKALRDQYDPLVWAEAEARLQLNGKDRQQLAAAETLLVWTIPPGPGEWEAALQTVQPRRLVLFANDPGMDQPQPLLTRLAGLGKYVIQQRQGETSLAELAAACAQRPGIIHMALLWLQAKGQIDFSLQADEHLQIQPGNGLVDPQLDEIQHELSSMLAESAAYRRYFSRAQIQALARNLTALGETHAN